MHLLLRSHSNSALLNVVQLRLPEIEKTYMDLVLQHRAGYKQRLVAQWHLGKPADRVLAEVSKEIWGGCRLTEISHNAP